MWQIGAADLLQASLCLSLSLPSGHNDKHGTQLQSYRLIHLGPEQVGEVVRCVKDSFFAADMVLLTSSNPEGVCYVETINLDGESNLKIKQGLDDTRDLSEDMLPTFKVWHKAKARLRSVLSS